MKSFSAAVIAIGLGVLGVTASRALLPQAPEAPAGASSTSLSIITTLRATDFSLIPRSRWPRPQSHARPELTARSLATFIPSRFT